MARKLKPVSVAGIEFDALIDEQKTLEATIPAYAVENGFPVSDTIILEPLALEMTLFVTNTPVTWLKKHGCSTNRVKKICNKLEKLWESKKLVKVVTTGAIYTNMGITSITIKKSSDTGYAREISLKMQKVRKTKRKTVKIPAGILKSGTTKANAGKASTSTSSSKTSTDKAASSTGGTGSSSGNSSGSGNGNASQKGASILYKAGTAMGYI